MNEEIKRTELVEAPREINSPSVNNEILNAIKQIAEDNKALREEIKTLKEQEASAFAPVQNTVGAYEPEITLKSFTSEDEAAEERGKLGDLIKERPYKLNGTMGTNELREVYFIQKYGERFHLNIDRNFIVQNGLYPLKQKWALPKEY